MITILTYKFGMGVSCLEKFLFGSQKDIRSVQTSYYSEDLIDTIVFRWRKQYFR